jgi:hypothetical protein
VAVRDPGAVQRLPGSAAIAESRPSRIGLINLEVKQTGERKAGNPHIAFDVAGAGNVAYAGAPVSDPTDERRLETGR